MFNVNDYEAWNDLGTALAISGRYEEAIANYDKALELKPDYKLAQDGRRIALEKLNRR